MAVNKDQAVLEWILGNPDNQDAVLFNYLTGHNGAQSVVPISTSTAIEEYIDGTKKKEYDLALQFMFSASETTDDVNIQHMGMLRRWQDWIEEQERGGVYPDFGPDCMIFEVKNLNNNPEQLNYGNDMTKLFFMVAIIYRE